MGIKIDLPVHTIEEATILDETLRLRSETLRAMAGMIHTTEEERVQALAKAVCLDNMRSRLMRSE